MSYAQDLADEGSSPPVRGARIVHVDPQIGSGLIPACAGSTTTRRAPSPGSRAHPRLCGEHLPAATAAAPYLGSSPPVRGAPILVSRPGRQRWAHPRLCGEHANAIGALYPSKGSSPPVRGAPVGWRGSREGGGLIPACAGSTSWTPSKPRPRRAHPRLCGEHGHPGRNHRWLQGSSPPVRGAPEPTR